MRFTRDWFRNESEFHSWARERMLEQGWHPQLLNDQLKVGIPDLSAAHPAVDDCWMELKVARRVRGVHDKMLLQHPLSAQQRHWLVRRAATSLSHCGVLVAYRTGPVEEPQPYAAWVPVEEWGMMMTKDLMTWCMRKTTAKISWLSEPGGFTGLVLGRTHH